MGRTLLATRCASIAERKVNGGLVLRAQGLLESIDVLGGGRPQRGIAKIDVHSDAVFLAPRIDGHRSVVIAKLKSQAAPSVGRGLEADAIFHERLEPRRRYRSAR